MKKILILLVLLCTSMPVMAYNYYSSSHWMTNPANPASPVNPMNPINMNRHIIHNNSNDSEYSARIFKVYEVCYKAQCRQTTSREVDKNIKCCLRHKGGNACLNIIIK